MRIPRRLRVLTLLVPAATSTWLGVTVRPLLFLALWGCSHERWVLIAETGRFDVSLERREVMSGGGVMMQISLPDFKEHEVCPVIRNLYATIEGVPADEAQAGGALHFAPGQTDCATPLLGWFEPPTSGEAVSEVVIGDSSGSFSFEVADAFGMAGYQLDTPTDDAVPGPELVLRYTPDTDVLDAEHVLCDLSNADGARLWSDDIAVTVSGDEIHLTLPETVDRSLDTLSIYTVARAEVLRADAGVTVTFERNGSATLPVIIDG